MFRGNVCKSVDGIHPGSALGSPGKLCGNQGTRQVLRGGTGVGQV